MKELELNTILGIIPNEDDINLEKLREDMNEKYDKMIIDGGKAVQEFEDAKVRFLKYRSNAIQRLINNMADFM